MAGKHLQNSTVLLIQWASNNMESTPKSCLCTCKLFYTLDHNIHTIRFKLIQVATSFRKYSCIEIASIFDQIVAKMATNWLFIATKGVRDCKQVDTQSHENHTHHMHNIYTCITSSFDRYLV